MKKLRALAAVFLMLLCAACSGNTEPATNIAGSAATLNAQAACGNNDDRSGNCYFFFRYGTNTKYQSATSVIGPVGATNGNVAISEKVANLSADTTYQYQFCGWGDGIGNSSNPACVGPDGTANTSTSFTTAPASTYGTLTGSWSRSSDDWPYAARPVVANHTVYIGSWDGYERAYDESGNLKWATNLGQTTSCYNPLTAPLTQGVTSAPAIDPTNGDLYLGDGTDNFDALNPNTGAILWSVPTDTSTGNYNWSSPLVYNGYAYIGTASLCDDPLTQGKLVMINLTTHQVGGVFDVVPNGQLGGGIWSSPVVDPTTNTVFVTTGTRNSASQTLSESIIALDASTLAVKGRWQIPDDCNPQCADLDFGTTPTLMSVNGMSLIAAANKNGYLYAFNRNSISAGPIWEDQIAVAASAPQTGEGSVSNGVFDGTYLYYAGGNTTIGGQSYAGSVRAINPVTGQFVWQRGLTAVPLAALTLANGEIVSPTYDPADGDTPPPLGQARAGLWVINAATGNVDYANAGDFYAPSTVADGLLFEGDVYGDFNVFNFPSAPGQAEPSAAPSVNVKASQAPGTPHHITVP